MIVVGCSTSVRADVITDGLAGALLVAGTTTGSYENAIEDVAASDEIGATDVTGVADDTGATDEESSAEPTEGSMPVINTLYAAVPPPIMSQRRIMNTLARTAYMFRDSRCRIGRNSHQ